jgi:hypothetical protein
MKRRILQWMAMAMFAGAVSARAADSAAPKATKIADEKPAADSGRAELEKQFEETLRSAVLKGRWCMIANGQLGEERDEQYTIQQVKKLGGDLWLFLARIKYGQRDLVIPLTLPVKWAGDTPVITLTKMTLPGLGTYSARVVIHEKTYAGTWSADDHGGLLHGVIEKAE